MLSSQESNVSELGRLLFKNSFTHVVHFTGTGRFLPSSSGQSLVSILTSMREGRPLSEDLWTALQARQVESVPSIFDGGASKTVADALGQHGLGADGSFAASASFDGRASVGKDGLLRASGGHANGF